MTVPRPHSDQRHLRRWLIGILAAGLLLRLIVLAGTTDLGTRIADEQHYVVLATSLSEGRGFSFANGPTSLRPPLYPAVVAGIWTLVGSHSLQAVRAVQAVLALLTVWLTYRLGCDLYDERAGLWAAAIAAAYPTLVFANALILTETLFAFLVIAGVTAVVTLLRRPSAALALCAGMTLGCAALTRSVLYPFPFVLAPLVGWWLPGSLPRRIAFAGLLLAGYAAVVAPWALRNTRLQGVPVIVDTMGGLNLRMGNYEYTPNNRIWDAVSMEGERSWIVGIPAAPPGGGPWTEGKKERWARKEALRFMVAHPGLTLWRSAIKFGDFWALDRDFLAGVQKGQFHPPTWLAVGGGLAMLVAYPLVLALALAAIVMSPPADTRGHIVVLLAIVFVCALHVIVFGHPRYRLPLMPLLMVYAGAALTRVRLGEFLDVRRSWPALAGGLLSLAIWIVQFAVRDWPFVRALIDGSAS